MTSDPAIRAVETPLSGEISPNATEAACESCGAAFRRYRRWARFCSPRCKSAAFLARRAAVIAGAEVVAKVIVYRQRRKRTEKPATPGRPALVAAMVRGLLTAAQRAG